MRSAHDSLGEVEIPDGTLWGAVTERARLNFRIGNNQMPVSIIHALARIKGAAASANLELGLLDPTKAEAIISAASEIYSGKHDAQFPLSVWQTGSGTHTNMNVNEVIAELAAQKGAQVHPNDDVNMGQSSNDTFPSALHIASRSAFQELLAPRLSELVQKFDALANQNHDVIKLGRTHCMDATPLRLGSEVLVWRDIIGQAFLRIDDAADRLRFLALGGTAVGTGINCHPRFGKLVAEKLGYQADANPFYQIASKDAVLHYHSTLKELAVGLIKISNDIRLYASGPRGGISELNIPANEPGSSIMPGKVNPTQVEAMTMVCAEVLGNDTTVTFAASQGNFQLNTYMPLLAFKVLESTTLLSDAISSFITHLLDGLTPNLDNIAQNLNNSLTLVTALNPHVGYELASKISKQAFAENRTLKDVALELTDLSADDLERILDPQTMV